MTESLLLDISAVPNFSRLLNNAFTNLLSGDSPYIATHALRVDFFSYFNYVPLFASQCIIFPHFKGAHSRDLSFRGASPWKQPRAHGLTSDSPPFYRVFQSHSKDIINTDSMDMNRSKLREIMKDRGA